MEFILSYLTNDEIRACETQLRGERETLLTTIRQRMHQSDNPGQLALANHFLEVREAAEADLLGDTDIGQLQIELNALSAVDVALTRITSGEYGRCSSCEGRISPRRLRAQPSATMCLACQEKWEKHGLPTAS